MRKAIFRQFGKRLLSTSPGRKQLLDVSELPERTRPIYQATRDHDLLELIWLRPPRNILLVKKDRAPIVAKAFVDFAKHIVDTYPEIAIVLEPATAKEMHEAFPFPVYTSIDESKARATPLNSKIDLAATLGGDGTILHASSIFASCQSVPPILSFSMGTLGFLGEWKANEYKRAFREVYMSGADENSRSDISARVADDPSRGKDANIVQTGWSSIRGKYMGNGRGAKVLMRNRLNVAIFGRDGQQIAASPSVTNPHQAFHAMNEVIIHRGRDPHLAIVEVSVGDRFLTEAVADGMIISTPTGSTAYSLSSGGSIVHPLVSSLLLTPICPRSLSFRPLVLPANTPITLRLSEKNRGREVDISIDGVRRTDGLGIGMEVRVQGEDVHDSEGKWIGGMPSIVRHASKDVGGEDSWVGGLNGLLKFNYPFGEEA